MKLPFVSRKAHDAAVLELESELDSVVTKEQISSDLFFEQIEELRDEIAQLTGATATASVIADALRAIATATAENTAAIAAASARMAHSLGAQAISQDKAANVQREWLELSKRNR